MAALPARGRRGALRGHEPGEPERKRVCKPLDTTAGQADTLLGECPTELGCRQKASSGCSPWHTKTRQNPAVPENHGSRGGAVPCPRCIAGESGHFSHIVGF